MPCIELILPGEQRETVAPLPEVYRITVERGDGIACGEMEARTAMSMFCIHAISSQKKTKTRRRQTNPQGKPNPDLSDRNESNIDP